MRLKRVLGLAGGVAAAGTLACLLQGIRQGLTRPVGRTTGPAAAWLRRPAFYLVAGLGFLGLGAGLWRPLPLAPPPWLDRLLLLLGALLYFPGLTLMVWGRQALGRMYFVSLTGGVQMFAGHRLITHGPYGWVRHPMYLGLLLVGLGGTLIYRTWTWVLVTLCFLGVLRRARLEERALADEFGAEWQTYVRRVPAWLPRLRSKG